MMTGLWPREMPRPTESVAEIAVYNALKAGLPAGWTAWHSLKLRDGEGWEGEGDFVIAVPGRGIVVLEVKGGRMEVHDGQWYQAGRLMTRAPRTQALGFAKLLSGRLRDMKCHAPYGVATVFPDTMFDNDPTQDDVRDTIFGAHDLPHICWALERGLGEIIPRGVEPPHGDWEGALHTMWCELWVPRVSLGTRHEINEERRIQMDRAQLELLDKTEKTRLALIYGLAGSGKTMLAREKALHAHAEGRRVTVLCYTDALAANLRASIACQDIIVRTVRDYATMLLIRAGVIKGAGTDSTFWDGVSRMAADRAGPPAGGASDMVIVDEAQDFSDGDWRLVRALVGDGGCWAFCDMTQRFWQDRNLPEWLDDGWVYDLENVYRCPTSIMVLARAVAGSIPEADGAPRGPVAATGHDTAHASMTPEELALIRQGIDDGVIKVIQAQSFATIPQTVDVEVRRLLRSGLQPDDIAVISLAGLTADDSIVRTKMLADKAVVRADNPGANRNLVCDTFLRFKGLERPAIIVTDLYLRNDPSLPTRLYIAMTRAQDCLRIVLAPGDLDNVPALRQICAQKAPHGAGPC